MSRVAAPLRHTEERRQPQLAADRPLGRFARGGAQTVLPPALRIASAVSILLYGAIALVLLDAAVASRFVPG